MAVRGAVQLERDESAHTRERAARRIAGGMPRVVRILAHPETGLTEAGISHVDLGEAAALRKDVAQ